MLANLFLDLCFKFERSPHKSIDAIILTIILLIVSSMETTRLSSKGQVIIPKKLRDAHHWLAGQELIAIDTGDGILLKPKKPFRETKLGDVAGCLQYEGGAETVEQMGDAIRQGVLAKYSEGTILNKLQNTPPKP